MRFTAKTELRVGPVMFSTVKGDYICAVQAKRREWEFGYEVEYWDDVQEFRNTDARAAHVLATNHLHHLDAALAPLRALDVS